MIQEKTTGKQKQKNRPSDKTHGHTQVSLDLFHLIVILDTLILQCK